MPGPIPRIGIYKIPPPDSLPITPHITRQLNVPKPGINFLIPTYIPLDYNPVELFETEGAKPPEPPDSKPIKAEIPELELDIDEEIECPGPGNLRLGDRRNAEALEKVIGFEIIDGRCYEKYGPTTFVDRYLPTVSTTAITFSITIVATAAATATPFVTKLLRPAFKQILNKIKDFISQEEG